MSSKSESRPIFMIVGGSSVFLAGGILSTITSMRDFLLYLDSYSLMAVGVTNSLLEVVLLLLFGSGLIVTSLLLILSFAVTDHFH